MSKDSLNLIIRDNLEYYNSILDYINNPKDENKRKKALDSFVHMGYMNYLMDDDKTLDERLKEYYKYFPKDK